MSDHIRPVLIAEDGQRYVPSASAAGHYVVGVGKGVDIVVPDRAHRVSKRHFELIIEGSTCYIRDLESTNGTRINGRPISSNKREVIRSGASIEFGNKRVALLLESPSETEEQIESPPPPLEVLSLQTGLPAEEATRRHHAPQRSGAMSRLDAKERVRQLLAELIGDADTVLGAFQEAFESQRSIPNTEEWDPDGLESALSYALSLAGPNVAGSDHHRTPTEAFLKDLISAAVGISEGAAIAFLDEAAMTNILDNEESMLLFLASGFLNYARVVKTNMSVSRQLLGVRG